MICPKCSSMNTDRSHRRGFVETHVISLFGFYPHRCLGCERRFMARCVPFTEEFRVRAVTAPPWVRAVGLIVFGLTAGLVVAGVVAGLNASKTTSAAPAGQELKDALKKN